MGILTALHRHDIQAFSVCHTFISGKFISAVLPLLWPDHHSFKSVTKFSTYPTVYNTGLTESEFITKNKLYARNIDVTP